MSVLKFKTLLNSGVISNEVYDSLYAFYKDYFSESHGKTICDSYIIYIEGIDFKLVSSDYLNFKPLKIL